MSLGLIAGCGGGGSAPMSPIAPTPTVPLSAVCGALGGSGAGLIAILNGSECPTANSALVLLNFRAQDGFAAGACSGTIIAPRAILTAAHCLVGETATARIWLGSGDQLPASSFTPHPDYRAGSASPDVGIVMAGEDLGRAPIPLLLSRDARVGEQAIIAGWGRDQNSLGATHRAGATTITAVGPLRLETQYGAAASSICAGDSGGPILVSEGSVWAIAGVSSATSETACNTGTNYYVTVRNGSVRSFVLGLVPDAAQR